MSKTNVGSIISLGCIRGMLDENESSRPKNPVLQLVRVNPGAGEQGGSRYKWVLVRKRRKSGYNC